MVDGDKPVDQSDIEREALDDMEDGEHHGDSSNRNADTKSKSKHRKSTLTDEMAKEAESIKEETSEMKMVRQMLDKQFGSLKNTWNGQLKEIDDQVEEIAEEVANPKKKRK